MSLQLIYPLNELDRSHADVAGGKGSSLGELIRAGAPVPPGFVVASAAFEVFMAMSDRKQQVLQVVQSLGSGDIESAEAAALIASTLADAPVPDAVIEAIAGHADSLGSKRVSVRSSATCEDSGASAWAGQLDTYLDVSPDQIVEKVRQCWLSIFSPSALAYGAAHGYGAGRISVAVVVQEMVASEVSGIGFSVHPVTQEANIMLIEACLGLGEAIVSGRIIPDQYVVQRGSAEIIERSIGGQREGLFVQSGDAVADWRDLGPEGDAPKLTDRQVIEYADLLSRIQDHYGHPVDTEWALQDGAFRLLQARPITTLAEEYEDSVIDMSQEWQQLVRRPMSLMEVSIWAHWLDSEHASKNWGVHVDRALSIQDETGMAIDFFTRQANEACHHFMVELFHNDRARVIETLQHGHTIYREAGARIEKGAHDFRDLDEAVDFFAVAAQYTTFFPALVLRTYEPEGWDDPEIRKMAEELRSDTLYPSIERRIIDPIAVSAGSLGFSAPERAPEVATWNELRHRKLDRDALESRLEAVRAGQRFVFQSIDGDESVRFLSQSGFLLMRLAKQRQIVPRENPDQLPGQAAWPGVYQGRARLVLRPDAIGQTFEDGEVLISIQSSPALMPLLQRCGAIVTDDGGIACHAAIIARELRKPTLIGTGSATSVIRTGDLVEVDTYAQVVRILERADAP